MKAEVRVNSTLTLTSAFNIRPSALLEDHLGSELNLPARRDGRRDPAEGGKGRLAVGRAGECNLGRGAEVRAVQQVECLDAELDAGAGGESGEGGALRERDVERSQIRTGEVAASGVPERTRGLQDERGRIEPLLGSAEHRVVGTKAGRVARAVLSDPRTQRRIPERSRSVGLDEDGERLTAAHVPDP